LSNPHDHGATLGHGKWVGSISELRKGGTTGGTEAHGGKDEKTQTPDFAVSA